MYLLILLYKIYMFDVIYRLLKVMETEDD